MKMIYLEGLRLLNKESAHEYLKEVFEFEDYYGKNLDALNDALYDIEEEITINIDSDNLGIIASNEYAFVILKIINDVCNNKDNIEIDYTLGSLEDD